MKKAFYLIALLVISFLVILGTILLGISSAGSSDSGLTVKESMQQNEASQDSIASQGISLPNLESHNSKDDCWIVYGGKVYDLTSWLPRHPGGASAILPYCGTTGFQEAFKRQHGDSQADMFVKVAVYIGDFKEVK